MSVRRTLIRRTSYAHSHTSTHTHTRTPIPLTYPTHISHVQAHGTYTHARTHARTYAYTHSVRRTHINTHAIYYKCIAVLHPLFNVYDELYFNSYTSIINCTLYTVQCTVYIVHCILYTIWALKYSPVFDTIPHT